jgi:hypothetical protein
MSFTLRGEINDDARQNGTTSLRPSHDREADIGWAISVTGLVWRASGPRPVGERTLGAHSQF